MRLLLACGLCLIATVPAAAQGKHPHHRVALALHDGVPVRVHPSSSARVLATLVEQTQVEVLKTEKHWYQVRLWSSMKGWLLRHDVAFRKPWSSISTYKAPVSKYRVHAHGPQAIGARAVALGPLSVLSSPHGRGVRQLATGTPVSVVGWQQDVTGKVWYQVPNGWVLGDSVQFQTVARKSLWAPVRGKGMWLTLGTVTGVRPDILVQAARRDGVRHLYVEAAISPLGFHGRNSVGDLITAAHAAHIAVIAWVYPYLEDIAADVALTRQVAAFRTVDGQRFDGIASDIERNMDLWRVRAYSQLIRDYLGPHYLLVGVTYPPQSIPTFPFAEVGRSFDVIAPMDYWHQTETDRGLDYGHMVYGRDYAYRYCADSIAAIQQAGVKVPIAPIGQTFDDFGRLEMGPHAPSGNEIAGFLEGCKSRGAVGVSFFQWMTVTDAEWRAIHGFDY